MKPFVVVAALGSVASPLMAAEQTMSIPVTPVHDRLVVALTRGDITITPGTSDAVLMSAACEPVETGPATEAGSFRSLRATSSAPNIVVGDDTISVRTTGNAPACDVTLAVPPNFELHTRINVAGSISVDRWRGSVLAWSADGDVNVSDHAGSLSVTAMNGNATVSLGAPGIDADSAITAANGMLTLTVDESAIPAMRAQARWGDIQTNLDVEFDEVLESGGTWFVTQSPAAGPLLTMRNLNANIVIRTSDQ